MRTTVDLPPELVRAAKARAAEQGESLKDWFTNVVLLDEPEGLERLWRALSAGDDQSHRLWTDDYLAAFAQAADLTLVTLDRSVIKRYPSVRVEAI